MASPSPFYWMIGPAHAQSATRDELKMFGLPALARALRHPRAGGGRRGDRGGRPPGAVMPSCCGGWLRHLAVRVEGHTAGASAEKIAAIAAAGFTSDHEPITAQEVLDRARPGHRVMLRESSLRPDLVGLLDVLKTAPALASRLMLTSDGSMPAFMRTHGFVDHLIHVALDAA